MKFYLQNGKSFVAQKGDIVFVPKGLCYTVAFFDTSNQFDSYTVNFLLNDELFHEIVLTDEFQVFKNAFRASS